MGSLDDEASLATLCAGADAVIHIAGVINAPDAAGFEEQDVGAALREEVRARRADDAGADDGDVAAHGHHEEPAVFTSGPRDRRRRSGTTRAAPSRDGS